MKNGLIQIKHSQKASIDFIKKKKEKKKRKPFILVVFYSLVKKT
jgi:hypothetical protein